MLQKSKEAQEILDDIRKIAMNTTREEQIELLKMRLGFKD